MSYHIEGKDIVMNGFEKGISDSVYSGVGDMRNMEIVGYPGESSVALATAQVTKPAIFNAVAFTSVASTDRLTVASVTGLYAGSAIVLNTNSSTGLSTGKVYYVQNIVGLTFQLSLGAAITTPVNFSTDGSGTLTTYQFAGTSPVAYYADTTGGLAGINSIFVTDNNAQLWAFMNQALTDLPANTLIFMGNIGGVAASAIKGTTGINIWNGYLFLFGTVTVGTDVADVGDLLFDPATAWDYTWQNLDTRSLNSVINSLVSSEDGNLYWISSEGLGSLIETPGDSFDPSDSASYSLANGDALLLPEEDNANCIAELGSNLLIGAQKNFVYVWNKIDAGFSGLLNIPDYFTSFIVAASNNAYVFAGTRGRIYITNGSGIDLYKKIPDYVTGLVNPFFQWYDANFGRNQLYFAFGVRNSAGTLQDLCSGAWAIDLESDALRMLNKTSDAAYAGTVRMVTPRPGNNTGSATSGVVGNSIAIGYYNSTASYIDYSTAVPYTNYESFLHTEMIPVGTVLDPFTPSQIEWKTSAPLVSGEGVRISYRTNIAANFTQIGESTTAGEISGLFQTNFEKAQWVQFLVETKSTSSTPSYARLTEIRVRDWPSGVNNKN